jgi:hypothetical protein
MIKKTVTYTDFDGNQVSEELHFNMMQTEALEFGMELPEEVVKTVGDGTAVDVNAASIELVKQLGGKGVYEFIKKLVLMSYGVREGKAFIKNAKIREEFEHSLAFDTFFMNLMSDDALAAEFVNGVLPATLADKLPNAQITMVPKN